MGHCTEKEIAQWFMHGIDEWLEKAGKLHTNCALYWKKRITISHKIKKIIYLNFRYWLLPFEKISEPFPLENA